MDGAGLYVTPGYGNIPRPHRDPAHSAGTGCEAIAIVGIACRLPGASGVDAFANLLFNGRDAVTEVPEGRWSKPRYFHPVPGQPGKTYSFAAGCLDHIDSFDAAFFGISPREAPSIDPQQRLMLELAYEACEDAGLRPSALAAGETGVFVGGSSWDFAANTFSDATALDAYSMQARPSRRCPTASPMCSACTARA